MSKKKQTTTATIKDVARLAGVSVMTVSRAINNPQIVSQKTLEIVDKAVEQLRYVPNLLAGGLKTSQSRLIAAIVPSIRTSMFSEAVEALSDKLSMAGYEVVLGISGFDPAREDKILSALLSRKPDAVFLTGIEHSNRARQQLLSVGIPVIESWDITPNPIDMVIGFSHVLVGRAGADLFLEKGYKNIAVISASDARAMQRRDGFLQTLAAHGKHDITLCMTNAPGSLESGRAAFVKLLQQGNKPDAVFCTVDPLAQGVITEAQVRNLRIPNDLAVMGFGDFSFSAHIYPSLTTIAFDRRKIGTLAAKLILEALNGRRPENCVHDIGFRVIRRQSTECALPQQQI